MLRSRPSLSVRLRAVSAVRASVFLFALSFALGGCGGGSGSEEESSSSGGGAALFGSTTVSGSISGQSGGQSRMAGWVVVLTERDTGISRVGEINASGIFTIPGVNASVPHGLTLLSPDYLVRGSFAVASETSNKLHTFFSMTKTYLPRLIHRGYVVTPQSLDGIVLSKDGVTDADGDGAPDGMGSLGLTAAMSNVDLDLDGVVNDLDADIDGDGLLNWFDSDDDADGLADVVDTDANGNLIVDVAESFSDQHFSRGIAYVAATVEVHPDSSSSVKTYLSMSTRVRDGVSPKSVQVRGPLALLNGSVIEATETTPQGAWDKLLLDDGTSEDGFANDGIYARKVLLGSGKAPRPFQTLFMQLGFDGSAGPVFVEYPFTFPEIEIGDLLFNWNAPTMTVAKVSSSDPFGSLATYTWSVSISNADGIKVYESPLVSAETESITIPDRLLESGSTYTFEAAAHLLDRIPGYPAFVVYSETQSITY